MSERSFAAWSVGLALVFAVVVPEPGQEQPSPAKTGLALEQAPAMPDKTVIAMPPAAAKAQPVALAQPAVPVRVMAAQAAPYTVERAAGVPPEPRKPILWASHAAP